MSNNKIQEQVFEKFKWLFNETKESQQIADSMGRTMNVNSWHERHNKDLEKAISRTIELMEEENNHLHSTLHCKLCKSMWKSGLSDKKADFRKMIEEIVDRKTIDKNNWSDFKLKREFFAKLGDDEVKK